MKAPKKAVIKSVKKRKKKLNLKLKKQKADGYEIVYATNKKFKKNKKTKRSKKPSFQIKKLKKGKTYFIKARAYRKRADGSRVYGKWSKVKKLGGDIGKRCNQKMIRCGIISCPVLQFAL